MDFRLINQDDEYVIRPLSVTEAPALFDAVKSSLSEISQWEPWCTNEFALSDAVSFLESVERNWGKDLSYDCNVVEIKSGLVVASVSINQINKQNRIGNVGYWTRTSHSRQGIASSAVRAISNFGFAELGLSRLEIVVQKNNVGSQRVAEKAGARLECVARNRLLFRGEPKDAKVFSLIPEDVHG